MNNIRNISRVVYVCLERSFWVAKWKCRGSNDYLQNSNQKLRKAFLIFLNTLPLMKRIVLISFSMSLSTRSFALVTSNVDSGSNN